MNVIRDVDPQDVADLGTDPPRACLAIIRTGRTCLLPVRARAVEGGYRITVRREDASGLDGVQALLVIDDGVAWFELRAVTARGTLSTPATATNAAETNAAGQQATETVPFLLTPRRVIAWDYGALRPSPDPYPLPRGG